MTTWNRDKVAESKNNLEGAELKGIDLSGLDLNKANLISAILVSANLQGISLIGANLSAKKVIATTNRTHKEREIFLLFKA